MSVPVSMSEIPCLGRCSCRRPCMLGRSELCASVFQHAGCTCQPQVGMYAGVETNVKNDANLRETFEGNAVRREGVHEACAKQP